MTTLQKRGLTLGLTRVPEFSKQGSKFFFEHLVDCEKAVSILFVIRVTLDVSCTVQLVGSEADNADNLHEHYRIGNSIGMCQGRTHASSASIPVDLLNGNQWHPFIGVEVTLMEQATRNQEMRLFAWVREQLDVTPQGQVQQNYEAAIGAAKIYQQVQQGQTGTPGRKPFPEPRAFVGVL